MRRLLRLRHLFLMVLLGGVMLTAQVVDVGGHPQAEYLQKLLQEKGGLAGLERYLNSMPALKTALVNMTGSMGNSQGTDWKLMEFTVKTMPGTRGDSLTIAFTGVRGSATLFEHFAFSGNRADIDLNQREVDMKDSRFAAMRALHDAVSSVRVAGAGVLKIYPRPQFRGQPGVFTADQSTLDRSLNDRASSVALEARSLSNRFSPLDRVVGLFQQYGPKVRITSPAAGTVWKPGQTQTIRWTSQRSAGKVDISLAEAMRLPAVAIPIVIRSVNVSAGRAELTVPAKAKGGTYVLRLTLRIGVSDSVTIRIRK